MELASVHSEFINGLVNAKSLGRYKILKKIGQGGSGVVYLARDSFIQRLVAVKISQSGSNKSRKRMFLEAQSAGRLNHPNILAIYDTGLYNKFCYIIMEYIEGTTLKAFCKSRQQLPPARCAEIIFNVCSAIDYAHKQGVIHRDIKPSNIMIDSSGAPKIMDFGIAQMTERTSEKVFGERPAICHRNSFAKRLSCPKAIFFP